MLAACLCCRKKVPKNEFLGLEGMVKIKNPEENASITESSVQIDSNISAAGETDSKRASSAPNRSLPDIPIAEPLNDNVSDLYATVGDKVQEKPQGRSPISAIKKQTSVSQHSSISQADDVSSPYARVKIPSHAYDKVRSTEHPYAQLNSIGPSVTTHPPSTESSPNNSSSTRGSNQSLLGTTENQQEILAASAIAGMVSASQELPYMTPPIVQQQPHFSGDSQDSSKGYTSISVREPLANILAQTVHPTVHSAPKEVNDSHYATVSDDSDEMYAAIDDPNNQGDTYTSGSETYAQIQPSNAITVAVEINTPRNQMPIEMPRSNATIKKISDMPVPPPVDTLKAQMHSRQASSSSNTSSVGNLGSPKPEKRQANSPLPPTPKNLQYLSNSNLTSSSSIPSGRNSVASIVECPLPLLSTARHVSKENIAAEVDGEAGNKKNFSPSKDIEGMYAKVMKKNKFSNTSSQNASPVLTRKFSSSNISTELNPSELDIKDFVLNAMQSSPGKHSTKSATYDGNNYETVDRRRTRSNSYDNKDHGYETIPGDKVNGNNMLINRKSEGYPQIFEKENTFKKESNISTENSTNQNLGGPINNDLCTEGSEPGYESLPDQSLNANDPGYESLLRSTGDSDARKPISDYDPNYETLRPTQFNNTDDGYSKVWEKNLKTDDESLDGYSRVKIDDTIAGYSSIVEKKFNDVGDGNHDYASIVEANKLSTLERKIIYNNNNNDETGSDIYSSIPNEQILPYLEIQKQLDIHNYQTIYETRKDDSKSPMQPVSNNSIVSAGSNTSDKFTISPSENNSSDTQMKCSSTSNTISSGQQHSSNYESLTGSESDPNYESVRYLDSENPYERLHNDSNISPETPMVVSPLSSTIDKSLSVSPHVLQASAINNIRRTENSTEVDDYFQV